MKNETSTEVQVAALEEVTSLKTMNAMTNETSIALLAALKEITSLNEQGVQLMKSRNYICSDSLFSRGTLKIKQTLHLMDGQHTVKNATGTDSITVVFLQASPQESSTVSKTEDRQVESQQQPFIFNHPLSIVTTTEQDATLDNFIQVASVLTYNHALSFHLSALDDQEAFTSSTCPGSEISSSKLRRALALYECSVELMSNSSSSSSSSSSADDLFLEMVILNNLGCIHATLNNTRHMQDCFSNLMVLLELAKEESNINKNSNNLMLINEQNLNDAFMVNIVSFFLFPNAIFQAAAA